MPSAPAFSPLRMAVVYVAIGSAWILASDWLLALLFPHPAHAAWLSMGKGIAFVAATGAVLGFLGERARRRLGALERSLIERDRSVRTQTVLLEQLFASTPEGIALLDRQGRVLRVNPEFERIFGFTAPEVVGRPIWETVVPPAQERASRIMTREVVEGQTRFLETHRRRKGGRPVEVSILGAPVHVEGNEAAVYLIYRDITARKEAERELLRLTAETEFARRQAEDALARYRVLVEQSLAGIYILDGVRFSYVNPRFAEIFGYSPEELTGELTLKDVVVPADWERVSCAVQRRMSGELDTARYHFRGRTRSGEDVLVEAHGTRAVVSGRTAIVGVLLDLTGLARAEAALTSVTHRYETLLNALPDMAWLKDREHRYMAVNDAMVRVVGMPRDALLGKTDYEVFPREMADKFRCDDERALRTGELVTTEEVVRRADGTVIDAETVKAPFRDHTGEWAGTAGIARDISQRLRDAEQLRLSEERLRQAQKMEAIGQLAGGVAHDFNNMLTVITGFGTLLSARLDPQSDAARDLEQIMKAADRSALLTRQLLAFSRKQILKPKLLDVSDAVLGLEKILRRTIGEDVELTIDLDPRPVWVRADPGQLEQVVMNLALNARDAMPEGGALRIATRAVDLSGEAALPSGLQPGPYAELTVSDTGCGIPPEDLEHIFEPFFTTKEQGKGTGLGLATVYGIVQQSGGWIDLVTGPGEGTTFRVLLPEAAADAPPAPAEAARPGNTRSETVLVVEDEDPVRALTVAVLRRAGFRVLEARDGEEALRLCERNGHRLDLVLADVVMPRLNGREVAERIHALHPEARVLFMSGYTDDAVLRRGIVQQESSFLQKPFTPAELLAKVEEVLGVG